MTNTTPTQIAVRNRRTECRFYIDNEFLNGYAKKVGLLGQAVYMALCRHERDGKAFPGFRCLAKELDISIGSVSAGVKRLVSYGIIKTTSGKQGKYTYYLMDHSQWKDIPRDDWSNKPR